jgi:hypothetical protein
MQEKWVHSNLLDADGRRNGLAFHPHQLDCPDEVVLVGKEASVVVGNVVVFAIDNIPQNSCHRLIPKFDCTVLPLVLSSIKL